MMLFRKTILGLTVGLVLMTSAQAATEKKELWVPVEPMDHKKTEAAVTKAVLESGGAAESATDDEIIEAMKLLAETEGVFTETAGGVTLAVARKLVEQGTIPRDESIVVCITGNGLKTQEPLANRLGRAVQIKPTLASFETTLASQLADAPTRGSS